MSSLELIQGSCADQNVNAVVNAANRNLSVGGGICGVIFKKAGYNELTESCKKYTTPLKDGDAVITPAFNMTNCKYIIHAVGPDFSYTPNAFKQLYDAYYNSFKVLVENGLTSISLPLISSGIYGGSLWLKNHVSNVYKHITILHKTTKTRTFLLGYVRF